MKVNSRDNVAFAHGTNFGIEVTGELVDGTPFSGTDTIRIIKPGNTSHPSGAADPESPAVAGLDLPPLEILPSLVTSTARISYSLEAAGPVSLRIYDAAGRLVRTLAGGTGVAGRHHATWDRRTDSGQVAGSGVYFVKLEQSGKANVQKLLIVE
jgi:hypothetical protein